jgi:two-component system, NarL family, sensor histidine kinase UhpB
MNKELRILYLEDSVQDAELTGRVLKIAGINYTLKLVDTQEEYEEALSNFQPDLILADHSLFQFNSSEALRIFKATHLQIPFILVTGTVSEEFAVNILNEGADDYLLKSNLTRLPSAINKSLEKYEFEKERQQYIENIIANESLMKEAEQLAHFGSWETDIITGEVKWSDETFRIYGYKPGEVKPGHDIVLHHIHPDDRAAYQHIIYVVLQKKEVYSSEMRLIDKMGNHKFVAFKIVVKRNESGQLIRLSGFIQDITERKKAEILLRESNERYEYVNKATLDTIWEWDFITNKGFWGEGIMRTFGYGEDKIQYNTSWIDDYIHPDDKERVIRSIEYHIENMIQNWQGEYRFLRADGSYRYVYDRGFILFDKKNHPYRMIGAMTDITEKRKMEKEMAEHALYQQKLLTEATIQAQEKERNELGKELHDNINQLLSVSKMFLGMAGKNQKKSEEYLSRSSHNLNLAIEEIRKLSRSLVAPSLGNIGLIDSLRFLAEEINLGNKLKVQVITQIATDKQMDNNMEVMLYRIAQEQLTNIRKYANAENAVITLKVAADRIFFSIADNGIGFDPHQKAQGIGLRNISSRVEFYAGNMNIISAPGHGCTLSISVPF